MVGGVARIFRLENEGNVTSVAKEIIVLIESKLECIVRTGILSGVAWVGSLERIKRISRMLVVSIFTRLGRVASVYMVTKIVVIVSKLDGIWKSEDWAVLLE